MWLLPQPGWWCPLCWRLCLFLGNELYEPPPLLLLMKSFFVPLIKRVAPFLCCSVYSPLSSLRFLVSFMSSISLSLPYSTCCRMTCLRCPFTASNLLPWLCREWGLPLCLPVGSWADLPPRAALHPSSYAFFLWLPLGYK